MSSPNAGAPNVNNAPKKKKRLVIWLLALCLFMAFILAGAGYWWLTRPATAAAKQAVLFTVNKGSGLNQIAKDLKNVGLIEHELAFILAARLQGAAASLKAGEYSITPGLSVWQLSRTLEEGRTNLFPVVLPEGFTMRQIIERLAAPAQVAQGRYVKLLDKDQALALANDPAFIASVGIKANSLEGYLFPETYFFSISGEHSAAILKRLVAHFDKAWASLQNNSRLNRHQLVTLASIIEKETGVDAERPLVSAVYHNRLRIGMPLQADPTVVYGQESNKPITLSQLKTDHPYNTYTRAGLPPGPICSPGLASLQAACNPADVDYLYFVATGQADGSHNFARTHSEHLKNVSIYRQRSRQ